MVADVALIGVGVMGEAVLSSLLTVVDHERVRISDGRPEHGRERAAAHGVRWVEQNSETVDGGGQSGAGGWSSPGTMIVPPAAWIRAAKPSGGGCSVTRPLTSYQSPMVCLPTTPCLDESARM